MSTLAQMRSRISDDLKRSDLDTQIDVAINRAILAYRGHGFWFTEGNASFVTTADQEAYTYASLSFSDVMHIHLVQITETSNDVHDVVRVGFNELRQMNDDGGQTTEAPFYYAVYNQTIYLAQIPDASYTFDVYYEKRYVALSADGDTNDFTTEAEDLIEARARWWLYNRIIKSKDKAADAKIEELEALSILDGITTRFIATGRIQGCY